jgi:hypothetical protein
MKRIFIAGTPRTGSMWTMNVTRALLKSAGKTVLPKEHPKDYKDEGKIIQEAFTYEPVEKTLYCLKTHRFLRNDLPETKIITNYRDVRDTMISYIRFMKQEKDDNLFEVAKKTVIAHMEQTDFYFEQHTDNLRIRFNDILNDPIRIINIINNYLALNVEEAQVLRIKEEYSKEKVSNLIKKLDKISASGSGAIQSKENNKAYQILIGPKGRYRLRDKETHFQTNHITSKKDGEWTEYFTSQQREEINEMVSGWLERYSFQL